MKYLLDTHILIWWYEDNPKLPKKYVQLLSEAEKTNEFLGLSIFSFWEIAKLVQGGAFQTSLSLDRWFQELEEDPLLKKLPLTGTIILDSIHLGASFPKDPSDQLIAATARCHELRLMTVDERIVKSGVVAIA